MMRIDFIRYTTTLVNTQERRCASSVGVRWGAVLYQSQVKKCPMNGRRYNYYYKQIISESQYLMKNCCSVMQLERIECLHLTISGNTAHGISAALGALQIIGGRRGKITRGKKSIANFSLRSGGLCATLLTIRGQKKNDMLDLLLTAILPNTEQSDIKTGFLLEEKKDTIGLRSLLEFPVLENKFLQFENLKGMHITANSDRAKCASSTKVVKEPHYSGR